MNYLRVIMAFVILPILCIMGLLLGYGVYYLTGLNENICILVGLTIGGFIGLFNVMCEMHHDTV